jgi:inhibitor of KinA
MRIFPLGDSAVTVEFGNEISLDLNREAIALSEHFESNPFPGFRETVPAYSSTTIFFDPQQVRKSFAPGSSAFEFVRRLAEQAAGELSYSEQSGRAPVDVRVIFDSDSSLDLEEVSEFAGLDPDEVISLFLERTYRVFMIGFLPGFAYMGEVDDLIAVPRKHTPRTKVPAGSVGIAGKQTGIYPLDSPGGWQIIGRTEMKMFDPDSDPSCPLRSGDSVKFVLA